ncbi:MAG: replicative DNA helicase [Bacteroidales bacterium]|nr:replicative DNA helicase [Bacteroidales bacterium]MDD4669517.1 replicative DNA helicase [Bacteroidales bacterium]
MAKNDKEYKKKVKVNIAALGEEIGGRKPPQAVDIEEAVLGALILEPNVIPDVLDQVTSECFYKDAHKKIFTAIANLSKRNDPVDILTVSDELTKSGELEEIGGVAYLSQLSLKIGAAAHVEYHTKVLLQKFIQRELISIAYKVQKSAYDDTLPVDELLDTAEEDIFTLAEKNMKRETSPIQDIITQAINDIEESQKRGDGLSGISSGFTNIDKVTFGWQKSDLIIVAARPSVGKTAFVLTMARNMAVENNTPVAFFSLEMPGTQLVKRLMVGETGLSNDMIRGSRKMDIKQWEQLNNGVKALSRAPLWIDDTPSLSIYEFRSKARRLVNNSHVKLIIIDYLQLMTGPPELRGMREQEVSSISRSLKSIAKELNVPIIALSQLNRSVEIRGGNKRPQLSDLRESGAIEQDADIVMFIHRPEMAGVPEEGSVPGETDLIIAKHRNGELRDIKMRFLKSETKFIDINDTSVYNDVVTSAPSVRYEQHGSKMNSDSMQPGTEFDN